MYLPDCEGRLLLRNLFSDPSSRDAVSIVSVLMAALGGKEGEFAIISNLFWINAALDSKASSAE